jgi:hypothetical protein
VAIALALATLTGFLAWRRRVPAARSVAVNQVPAGALAANSVAASSTNHNSTGNGGKSELIVSRRSLLAN